MTPKIASRLLGLFLVGLLSSACQSLVPPDGLALVGATLIDGSGDPLLTDAVLVIRGGRVESVGSMDGFEPPPRTREVDVRGRWIIPGLIDAHAHLAPAAEWAPVDRLVSAGIDFIKVYTQDQFLRIFHAAGGRVATGTDAGNKLMVPGSSEHRELELMVRAGFTSQEVLRAATRNGAMLLGVDTIGLLAAENAADLIVLARDPLADIRNTRSIEAVMFQGRLLDPDSIRATW